MNRADADRCLSGEFGSGRRMESFGIEQFACCLDYPLSWRFRSYLIAHAPLSPIFNLFSRRSEEHTSELQSLMRISYAVFCLKKKTYTNIFKIRQYITP